jgi:hypothetical protein
MADDDEAKPGPDDPQQTTERQAQNRITAVVAAITRLVTDPPNLIGIDIADYRAVFGKGGPALFGQGEASGPGRATRAAEAAMDDIRRQLGTLRQQQEDQSVSEGETRPDNTGRSIGEGPERNADGSYTKSGIAQQEQAQKAEGNPKEKQAEAERINRDDARHRQGFPVAGHGERHRDNDDRGR